MREVHHLASQSIFRNASKEIIERHGGEIGVDTDRQVRRFWFWIGAA